MTISDNEDGNDGNDGDFPQSNLYECILTARDVRDERKNTRNCCEEQGGQLYEARGHCIFRDVTDNLRDEWRQCAEQQRGSEFAECYAREQREIDDELAGRGLDGHDDRRKNHRNHKDHRRHGSHRTSILDGGRDDDNDDDDRRNNDHFECRVDLNDENRRREILQQCCEDDVQGRIDQGNQVCRIKRRNDRDEFERCAIAQGAQNAECYREWLIDMDLEL